MKHRSLLRTVLPLAASLIAGAPGAHAQLGQTFTAFSPGLNYDSFVWAIFTQAVTPVPGTPGLVTFETWATDPDTYQTPNPTWPTLQQSVANTNRFQPSLLNLAHIPQGLKAALQSLPTCSAPGDPGAGNFPTKVTPPPANCIAEEVRRNRSSFDYIVQNNLYTTSGLVAAYRNHMVVDLPWDAIELKADWIPVPTLIAWLAANGKTITAADVANDYYVTQSGGASYALAAMHISSKALPDWVWATFEHEFNPGRCDTMGCYDQYGISPASSESILPASTPNTQYAACTKSAALARRFAAAGLSPVWNHYCLKATQIDFVSAQGVRNTPPTPLPVLDGNSVTERINADVPIANASCISCHKTASFNSTGALNFTQLGQNPIGDVTVDPNYRMNDFVWGIIAIQ